MDQNKILGYTIVNAEKFERAVNGSMTQGGVLQGGVGEKASDKEKLAEYDRLGGLVLKGKYKVKMGCFYDFAKKAPFAEPKVIFSVRVNDKEMLIDESGEIPLEARAAVIQEERKLEEMKKKSDKVKGTKAGLKTRGKKEVEESEDEEGAIEDEE